MINKMQQPTNEQKLTKDWCIIYRQFHPAAPLSSGANEYQTSLEGKNGNREYSIKSKLLHIQQNYRHKLQITGRQLSVQGLIFDIPRTAYKNENMVRKLCDLNLMSSFIYQ